MLIPLDAFFGHLAEFRFRRIFDTMDEIWEPVGRINTFIRDELARLEQQADAPVEEAPDGLSGHTARRESGAVAENLLLAEKLVLIQEDTLLRQLSVFLGRGTIIEPGVVIKPYALIGEENELRQGAYLRGNVIAGSRSVIGHATEVKNSILTDNVEAGHFAYVGDSILGYHVNLGAGTKLANLQLRSPAAQETGTAPSIKITIGEEPRDTGLAKLGAVLGDHVEIGCNAVTSPGTLVGRGSWIYPCVNVRKGYYPPDCIIKRDGTVVTMGSGPGGRTGKG